LEGEKKAQTYFKQILFPKIETAALEQNSNNSYYAYVYCDTFILQFIRLQAAPGLPDEFVKASAEHFRPKCMHNFYRV
jgi:hypothetical protein